MHVCTKALVERGDDLKEHGGASHQDQREYIRFVLIIPYLTQAALCSLLRLLSNHYRSHLLIFFFLILLFV